MDLFEYYESSLLNNLEEARHYLELHHQGSGEDKKSSLAQAEAKLKNAELNLASVNNQAKTLPNPKCREAAKKHEIALREVKIDVDRAKNAAMNAQHKASLLEGGTGAVTAQNASSMADRDRTVETVHRFGKNNDTITEMREILDDTHQTADATLEELYEQRGVLEGLLDRLRGINADLASARRTIRSMSHRFVSQKIILLTIAGVLVFIIFMVIFIRFFWSDVFGSS